MNSARPTGGVSYKTGIVVDSKPGFARVRFADIDDLTTQWLPVIHPKTLQDKVVWTLDVGEHVSCLLDEFMEDGCILGAIYSDPDVPPVSSKDKFHLKFDDGGSIEYDRSNGAMTVVCKGVVNVTADGAVTVKTPVSVTIDTPQTTITGKCTVQGLLTYNGGMVGKGGGGVAASIQGNVQVDGNVDASGTIIDAGGNTNHHSH